MDIIQPIELSVQLTILAPTVQPGPAAITPVPIQIRVSGVSATLRPGPVRSAPSQVSLAITAVSPTLKHVPFSVYPIVLDGDERPLAVLETVYDYRIQDHLLSEDSGQEILMFKIPVGGKSDLIVNERVIRVLNRDYVVRVIDDKRDQNGLLIREVTAEAIWYDIATEPPVQPNVWVNQTADVILADILKGTGWDVGTVEPQQKAGFIVSEPTNVLVCLRQIAVTFGAEIYFDTRYRMVSLLSRVGQERHVLLAKGKNITEMLRREDTRSIVTRLYPYGKDNLSIKEINGGKEYIEDYSYFDQRGLPRKTISSVWKDERYTDQLHLKTTAAAKLSQLAQPAVSYNITGVFDEHMELGDIVQVYDQDIGLHASFRVSQRDWYPIEPWRTQLQLEQPLPLLSGQLIGRGQARAGVEQATTQATFAQGMNPSAVTIGATSQAIVAIPISTLSSTDAEFTVTITGQASAATTLTVAWMLNGQQIGPTLKHTLASGWNTFSASFILKKIPQSSGILNVMASVSSGTFSVDIGAAQGYIYAANMIGGGDGMPTVTVEESLPAIITMRENLLGMKLDLPSRVNLQEQLPATLVIQDQVSIQLI